MTMVAHAARLLRHLPSGVGAEARERVEAGARVGVEIGGTGVPS